MSGAESLMEISSTAPSLSTRKLNSPKAMSKLPVIVETAPAVPEVGPTMVAAGVRSVVLGEAVSMTVDSTMSTSGSDGLAPMMAGTAMPMTVSMVVSMSILALVGDGAGEFVDPDPVVPTDGAN
jgi:hypothetical protein